MLNFKRVFFILLTLFLAFSLGCSGSQPKLGGELGAQFAVSPTKASLGQKITVTLPQDHPLKMSIRDPKGVWHWVHEPEENILFLPYSDLKSTTQITLLTSKLRGVSWDNGKKVAGLVFNQPGEYLLYFADNLETEPENTFHFKGTVMLVE